MKALTKNCLPSPLSPQLHDFFCLYFLGMECGEGSHEKLPTLPPVASHYNLNTNTSLSSIWEQSGRGYIQTHVLYPLQSSKGNFLPVAI